MGRSCSGSTSRAAGRRDAPEAGEAGEELLFTTNAPPRRLGREEAANFKLLVMITAKFKLCLCFSATRPSSGPPIKWCTGL